MGIILRTDDGGKSWVAQSSSVTGTFCALFSVSFADINHGTFVGSNGIVQHTSNGGANWNSSPGVTNKNLHGICFKDANHGTIVGDAGTILQTTNGGTTWRSQSAGTNTTIDYELKNNGWVSLKIIDLLGKEICTLVNENKPAGKFSINFDGSELEGGIYFYSLSANNITETHTMLLIK